MSQLPKFIKARRYVQDKGTKEWFTRDNIEYILSSRIVSFRIDHNEDYCILGWKKITSHHDKYYLVDDKQYIQYFKSCNNLDDPHSVEHLFPKNDGKICINKSLIFDK